MLVWWGFPPQTQVANYPSIHLFIGLPFYIQHSVGHWGNKWSRHSSNSKKQKHAINFQGMWIGLIEVTTKCCGMKGTEEAIVPRVWGTEVEVSWATSTVFEDLLSARHIPGYKDPKMGNVEIGWGGLLVLWAGQYPFPTLLLQDLNLLTWLLSWWSRQSRCSGQRVDMRFKLSLATWEIFSWDGWHKKQEWLGHHPKI